METFLKKCVLSSGLFKASFHQRIEINVSMIDISIVSNSYKQT